VSPTQRQPSRARRAMCFRASSANSTHEVTGRECSELRKGLAMHPMN